MWSGLRMGAKNMKRGMERGHSSPEFFLMFGSWNAYFGVFSGPSEEFATVKKCKLIF